jgi:hypothetical protein
MASFLPVAKGFVRVDMGGIGPMIDTLKNLATTFEARDDLTKVLRRAAVPIRDTYRAEALKHDATGNLAASTKIKTKKYPGGNAVAVAGPEQTGSAGATTDVPSGNHAWLVEFGSHGRRSPSKRGKRRTYVNVHKSINRKMKLHSKGVDSEKFKKMGAGHYFLMSSWNEPTRQARKGKGYTHDFLPDGGVYTLKAGATYGAMPGYHLMEKTIAAKQAEAQAIMKDGIIDAINKRLAGKLP